MRAPARRRERITIMPVISVYEALPGMRLSDDVFSLDGKKLIGKGTALTRRHIEKLRKYQIREIHIDLDGDPLSETGTVEGDPSGAESPSVERPSSASIPVPAAGQQAYLETVQQEAKRYLDAAVNRFINLRGNVQVHFLQCIRQLGGQLIEDPQLLKHLGRVRTIGDGSFSDAIHVMVLSLAIALQMRIDHLALRELGRAALLFDIGKCHIDRSILMKRGPLTPEEFEAVKEHTLIGYAILRKEFDEAVARVALEHHERYNGSGYPKGISNDEMHPFSRIVAVADVFISLISNRIYRAGYQPHEAIEYLYGAGGLLFDPDVIAAFMKVVSLYTVGMLVELNNGWIGVVREIRHRPVGRPLIEIIMDERRRPANRIVDLNEEYQFTVQRVLDP